MSESDDLLKRWEDMAAIYEQQIEMRDWLAKIKADLPAIKAGIDAKNAELTRLREAVREAKRIIGILLPGYDVAKYRRYSGAGLSDEEVIRLTDAIRAWLEKYGESE